MRETGKLSAMKLAAVTVLFIVVISLSLAESQGPQVNDLDELDKAQDIKTSNLKKDIVAEIERVPNHYMGTLRFFQHYVKSHICNPVTNRMMRIGDRYLPSRYKKSFYNGVRNMVNRYICGPLNRKLAAVFRTG